MGVDGGAEPVQDDLAGDRGVSSEINDVAGVVVKEGEDLAVLAVGERPVREV